MHNNKCPVCGCEQSNEAIYCFLCGWEFVYYLTGMTPEEQELYQARLMLNKTNWAKLKKADTVRTLNGLISKRRCKVRKQPARLAAAEQTPQESSQLKTGSGQVVLVGLAGQFKGQEFVLSTEPLSIGRDPQQCHIVYPSAMNEISRVHCILRFDERRGVFCLKDCSSNGTFLLPRRRLPMNGEVELQPGQRFYLNSLANMFEFVSK